MKHVPLFVAAALAFALAGCGGSSSSSGGSTVTLVTRIEAVTKSDTSLVQDPTNFQEGEDYYFELVSYDAQGNRSVLSNVDWKSGDDSGTYGTLAGNSGLYSAGVLETPSNISIRAIYNGNYYSSEYAIKPQQIRLSGKVASESTGTGLDGVVIDFYNDSSNLVGTVTTGYNGTFRASIASSANYYMLRSETIPTNFYRSFLSTKSGTELRYDSGQTDCLAPLPNKSLEIGPLSMEDSVKLTVKVTGQSKPDQTGCTTE